MTAANARRRRFIPTLFFGCLAAAFLVILKTAAGPSEPPIDTITIDDGSIVALPDGSTLRAPKGTIGREMIDWIASGDRGPKTFEVDGRQFLGQSTNLTPAARGRVTRLFAMLEADPDVTIAIVGHAGNSGDRQSDEALALARADELARLLETAGISRARLSTEGHVADESLRSDDTAADTLDDRVSFTLSR